MLLSKLGSLAGLALSAGRARRDYLRRSGGPTINAGFHLSRAHLLIAPVGLDVVVRAIVGQPASAPESTEFARDLLLALSAAIAGDSGPLPAVLNGLPPFSRFAAEPKNENSSARQQLKSAALLHTAIGGGSAVIELPPTPPSHAEQIAELLHVAWDQPGLSRFHFHNSAP
jgi:hypothetical protein